MLNQILKTAFDHLGEVMKCYRGMNYCWIVSCYFLSDNIFNLTNCMYSWMWCVVSVIFVSLSDTAITVIVCVLWSVLQNMVMTFRVSELQMLLGFAGRNKSGRKTELQTRALELLRLKSTPIQMKIRELYKSIQ